MYIPFDILNPIPNFLHPNGPDLLNNIVISIYRYGLIPDAHPHHEGGINPFRILPFHLRALRLIIRRRPWLTEDKESV